MEEKKDHWGLLFIRKIAKLFKPPIPEFIWIVVVLSVFASGALLNYYFFDCVVGIIMGITGVYLSALMVITFRLKCKMKNSGKIIGKFWLSIYKMFLTPIYIFKVSEIIIPVMISFFVVTIIITFISPFVQNNVILIVVAMLFILPGLTWFVKLTSKFALTLTRDAIVNAVNLYKGLLSSVLCLVMIYLILNQSYVSMADILNDVVVLSLTCLAATDFFGKVNWDQFKRNKQLVCCLWAAKTYANIEAVNSDFCKL